MTGTAMKMRLELARLAKQHGVSAEVQVSSLLPECDDAVIMDGFASTTEVDLDRMKFRPYCFSILPWQKQFPPLLLKHNPQQVVGRIDQLGFDRHGNLKIRCTVDHELARRMPAFSVQARVDAYTLHAAGTPDFHAEVTAAEITEISLTDMPSNPNAVVMNRYPVSPKAAFFDLMKQRVAKLTELAQLLKGIPT